MSQPLTPLRPSLLARRLCDFAHACAARHAAALVSACAFALLGAPLTGLVVAALIATLRSRATLEITLRRLRNAEDELNQLRVEVAAAQARAENLKLEAQRRSAVAAIEHERERARVAEHVQRVVCDPARAIAGMLNGAGVQATHCPAQLIDASFGYLIHSAITTFAQNIHDVFDPPPGDARSIVLDESPVDLCDVIDAAVALLAPRAIAKGLQMRVCVDRSLAASVLGDRQRIGQIVFNLLDAAISFTSVGRLTLASSAETLNAGSQRVFIGVSGAQPGARFDVPTATDCAVPDRSDAQGDPDLALCRVLAERMGGNIEVGNSAAFGLCIAFHAPFTVERPSSSPASNESRRRAVIELPACDERVALCDLLDKLGVDVVPAGAPAPAQVDFWFTDEHMPASGLPHATRVVSVTEAFIPGGVSEADGRFTLSVNPLCWSAVQRVCASRSVDRPVPERRLPMHDTQAHARTVGQRTVLVVDDNEINRKVVARQLDVLGYRCVTMPGVEPAVAAMARQDFDLLITDLHMPGSNGVEFAAQVRAMNRNTRRKLPVVLVTGETDTANSTDVPAALFDAVLPKPAGLDALRACLNTLFDESPLNAAHDGAEQEEQLDRRHLDALSEHGIDVREVVSGWQQAMEEDLMYLHACRERGDSDGLHALLHRLSGALGVVGATGLMEDVRQAGAMRPQPSPALIDSLVARMRVLIAQLQRGVDAQGQTYDQTDDHTHREQTTPLSGAVAAGP
ncbi:response regulator [Paraburkholderia rhizosphaerae]|uniref:Response regulator receiver domain-containing protein n=1 Tax=Paraburkholderia rhizosphaerae TaxID=480658 RepID=A0A4V3HFQ4_9BURK|nr:response regulator [Paraburkholderia rhizosphaerae]TDY54547.1 response regulator receiver domain-containing protein [Paraburkholderia rhizosphaerae]